MRNKLAILSIGLLLSWNVTRGQDFSNLYNPHRSEDPQSIDAVLSPPLAHPHPPVTVPVDYKQPLEQKRKNSFDNTKLVNAQLSKLETDLNKPSIQVSLNSKSYDPVATPRDRFVKSPCFGELGFDPFMDVAKQEEMYRICESGKRQKQFKDWGIILGVVFLLLAVIVYLLIGKKK